MAKVIILFALALTLTEVVADRVTDQLKKVEWNDVISESK